ncbi:protein kinase [Aspergillus heteromorphus CBS 117.55]|uniref:Protein kinase n=1 Tax=Aspergillus heteromorphus CBS 117.55 TaxID=1448321 RepID=A0A317VZU1_9EURO|nr:protein kinase [Aspergillus heteromorphus CBS 117.55]PWY77410.1 protein kinase [Aspergillus heteromorphus CBS 117.55]
MRQFLRRPFASLREPLSFSPGPLLPKEKLIDEEVYAGYNSKSYYPAKAGEVLDNRYQLVVKVGWGVSSTVWFALDMRGCEDDPRQIVALKIGNTKEGKNEYEIEEHIAQADPSARGLGLLRTSSERFEITGPEGTHICLAYEPMREPFWLFRRRFVGDKIPLPVIKAYVRLLLEGLDYLHTKCMVAHTDLKLENIMVDFEDPDVLLDFMSTHLNQPMSYKIDSTGRSVYRRCNDFGPLRAVSNAPRIVDFGQSDRFYQENELGIYPIQANHYRAPEVILGCGWRMPVDIWSLGALLWDIIHGDELFRQVHDSECRYTANAHLAEMIALLGPPPPKMITRYHSMRELKWPKAATFNGQGPLCQTTEECFGGPFFDEDGKFLYEELIPDRKLEDTITFLEEEEREGFLSFVGKMLVWHPSDRATAAELMEHPFLDVK